MSKKVPGKRIEFFIFYSFLFVNACFVIFTKSIPSLDGPAHLYYSHLINYLCSGNEFIGTYFSINKFPVPNLTDHYLLALFTSLLSYTVAEKILLLIYIIGFPLSFRYVIKTVNPECIGLSAFAIVFSQSFLYYIGFYNFCLSFVLLFAALGIYFKRFANAEQVSVKGYILLFLLVTLTYFTNGLSFVFLAAILFLYELSLWINVSRKKIEVVNKKKLARRTLLFILLWLPSIICFYIFIKNIPIQSGDRKYPVTELLHWVRDIRPLIVYSYADQPYTRIIFILLCVVSLVAVYFRLKSRTLFRFLKADIFLLAAAASFAVFLIIPDSASVGMMSVRLCYYIFIFFIVWLAMQKGSGEITWVIPLIALSIQTILLFGKHYPDIAKMNDEMEAVRSAGENIKPNSIVLSIDVTDDWPLMHFADYIGIDKPIAIAECYEASYGWFAVNWNKEKMPKLLLGDKTAISPVLWTNNLNSPIEKHIDYVFVYGDINQISEPKWLELKTELDKFYKSVFTSADGRIHIFGLL
jgi:hypothetical protein